MKLIWSRCFSQHQTCLNGFSSLNPYQLDDIQYTRMGWNQVAISYQSLLQFILLGDNSLLPGGN